MKQFKCVQVSSEVSYNGSPSEFLTIPLFLILLHEITLIPIYTDSSLTHSKALENPPIVNSADFIPIKQKLQAS